MPKATAQPPVSLSKGINRNVVALGIVSLLTDASTEMILPVLPLFLVGVLHASAAGVGVIEGVAECTATVLRLGSGWLSDRTGARGPLMLLGYGISGVAKGALAVAGSWGAVLGLRFADRVGKGIRNPPRDAVIADSVEPDALGRGFGFHRALDTLGAAIGPLIAFAMLSAFPGDFRRIFAWSVLPATLSVLVIVFAVRVPKSVAPATPQRPAPTAGDPGAAFRRFVLSAGLFSLANSSTAFLLLRARGAGFSDRAIPLVYLLYNLVYALLSWPVGALSDRMGRRGILIAAYLLFAGVYALLAASTTHVAVIGGFALLGVHSALLEGSQRSMIADLVPQGRRATAYGIYYAVVGIALLPASILAGALWDRFGAAVALGIDAGLALLAALLFALLLPPRLERAATAGPT
jgi:MFS family permease